MGSGTTLKNYRLQIKIARAVNIVFGVVYLLLGVIALLNTIAILSQPPEQEGLPAVGWPAFVVSLFLMAAGVCGILAYRRRNESSGRRPALIFAGILCFNIFLCPWTFLLGQAGIPFLLLLLVMVAGGVWSFSVLLHPALKDVTMPY